MYEARQNKVPISRILSLRERKDVKQLQSLQNIIVAKYPNSNKSTLQRTIYNSIEYPVMSKEGKEKIQILHDKIEEAERSAQQALCNPTTANLINYTRNPSPKSWGYCVEEQLNNIVQDEWTTQFSVGHLRPDYYQKLATDGIELFVDLTTERESGPGGPHITEKLDYSGFYLGNKTQAADITHRSLNPNLPNNHILQINGIITEEQKESWRAYTQYINLLDEAEFSPKREKVFNYYKSISYYTFIRIWNYANRESFCKKVKDAGF